MPNVLWRWGGHGVGRGWGNLFFKSRGRGGDGDD